MFYQSCVGRLVLCLNSGSIASFKSHVIYNDCLGYVEMHIKQNLSMG